MYKLDIPADKKQIAAIERRRILEEERKKRIFSPPRTDVHALDAQVWEKKEKQMEEAQEEAAYAAYLRKQEGLFNELQTKERLQDREMKRSLNEFRRMNQHPKTRTEFDVHDPDAKKKAKPIDFFDPSLGISSAQVFEGEDIAYQERKKLQQQQMKEWAQQKKQEDDLAKTYEQEKEAMYQRKLKQLQKQAEELQLAEDHCQRAMNVAQKDFNHEMVKQKKDAERQKQLKELEENVKEMHCDMLGEGDNVRSALGIHRVAVDRWRGMTPDELTEIRKTQEAQRVERQQMKEAELKESQAWDRFMTESSKKANNEDWRNNNKRKETARAQAEQNKLLAEEQQRRLKRLYNETYTNVPTEAFFNQFGTSSR